MAGTINSWGNQIAGSSNQIILNAGTNGVAISTDASAATVNVATGGAVKTSTFGSTNSTSATTVQSGSGALNVTSTNGALTINSGTGALGISTDASATTISIGTGAAVKGITLGSTNTTSSTAIKSGSGNVILNTGLTVDSTGRMTNGTQPCFLAYNSSNRTNATGAGGVVTVTLDTEVFDIGNNFATNTFTAPITGKYFLSGKVRIANLSTANISYLRFTTSNRTVTGINDMNPTPINGAEGVSLGGSIVTDMDAADTVTLDITCGGQATTVTITGQAAPDTYFSGFLAC